MRCELRVTTGSFSGRRMWVRDGQTIQIGRTEYADLCIADDPLMSRVHFALDSDGGMLRIRDLGSRNGTFVNGQLVKIQELNHGDQIVAGQTWFDVQVDMSANQDPRSSVSGPAAMPNEPGSSVGNSAAGAPQGGPNQSVYGAQTGYAGQPPQGSGYPSPNGLGFPNSAQPGDSVYSQPPGAQPSFPQPSGGGVPNPAPPYGSPPPGQPQPSQPPQPGQPQQPGQPYPAYQQPGPQSPNPQSPSPQSPSPQPPNTPPGAPGQHFPPHGQQPGSQQPGGQPPQGFGSGDYTQAIQSGQSPGYPPASGQPVQGQPGGQSFSEERTIGPVGHGAYPPYAPPGQQPPAAAPGSNYPPQNEPPGLNRGGPNASVSGPLSSTGSPIVPESDEPDQAFPPATPIGGPLGFPPDSSSPANSSSPPNTSSPAPSNAGPVYPPGMQSAGNFPPATNPNPPGQQPPSIPADQFGATMIPGLNPGATPNQPPAQPPDGYPNAGPNSGAANQTENPPQGPIEGSGSSPLTSGTSPITGDDQSSISADSAQPGPTGTDRADDDSSIDLPASPHQSFSSPILMDSANDEAASKAETDSEQDQVPSNPLGGPSSSPPVGSVQNVVGTEPVEPRSNPVANEPDSGSQSNPDDASPEFDPRGSGFFGGQTGSSPPERSIRSFTDKPNVEPEFPASSSPATPETGSSEFGSGFYSEEHPVPDFEDDASGVVNAEIVDSSEDKSKPNEQAKTPEPASPDPMQTIDRSSNPAYQTALFDQSLEESTMAYASFSSVFANVAFSESKTNAGCPIFKAFGKESEPAAIGKSLIERNQVFLLVNLEMLSEESRKAVEVMPAGKESRNVTDTLYLLSKTDPIDLLKLLKDSWNRDATTLIVCRVARSAARDIIVSKKEAYSYPSALSSLIETGSLDEVKSLFDRFEAVMTGTGLDDQKWKLYLNPNSSQDWMSLGMPCPPSVDRSSTKRPS